MKNRTTNGRALIFAVNAALIGALIPPAPTATAADAPTAAATPVYGILRWKNGETLPGNIAAAFTDEMTWKTPFFEEPLQLRWNVVDRIDWPPAPLDPPADFGIALRDGSFIYGDLASIGADTIEVHSARHGDAFLKRSEVLGIRRMVHDGAGYAGPRGDQGWVAMSNQPDGSAVLSPPPQTLTPPLATGPGGSLAIQTWNRSAYLNMPLPERLDVEFRVRSSSRPEFLLSLGADLKNDLRIETWDNTLVLTQGAKFKVIRKIQDPEREVALRVFWEKETGKCEVYGLSGEKLADWQLPPEPAAPAEPVPRHPKQHPLPAAPAPVLKIRIVGAPVFNLGGLTVRRGGRRLGPNASGIILQNRGLDLTLDFLRVRDWDGKLPNRIDPAQPRLELSDGRSVSGQVVPSAQGSIHLLAGNQTAPTAYPIDQVDALMFSPDAPRNSEHELTLCYNDGAMVCGNMASVKEGKAAIATSFTATPLFSQLDQLRQLIWRAPDAKTTGPAPDLSILDEMVVEQTTLHGRLRFGPNGALLWNAIGSVQPATPSHSVPCEIALAASPKQATANDPALFYLSTGDVLPGRLKSIDRTGAELESSIVDARKLPAGELAAIAFTPSGSLDVEGFGDPPWRILKGDDKSVRRTGQGIQLDPGTSIFSPSLMQSSEVRFKFIPNGYSCVRLQMFCSSTHNTHAVNLLLGSTGSQFICGEETEGGQFLNQSQLATTPGEPISILLKIADKSIEVLANDVSIQEIAIDPASLSEPGLRIEPAGMWGNNVTSVSLSDFSAHSLPGRSWVPDVTADVKNQVLTVPRFEKNDPPRHVLLAENGDVLRGEIEAATDSTFGFRSGLETLNVPRARVRAVICLQPPDANAPAATATPPPDSSVLEDSIPMRVTFGGAGVNTYMSFIKSQVPNLNFKLPEHEDETQVQMMVGGETVSEALNQICARFSLHYRIDKDGTIVLESETDQPTLGRVFKSYWLKPGTFPDEPSAQEILAGKGITFADDASAQWQPQSGLLSMYNDAANQAKLAGLVGSDFGGSLGSPSYWLVLKSGGRMPIAVDAFAADTLVGHNPAYGTVKVPISEVYSVRTSPPEQNATSQSLANWRLINAPEPAIPDDGGQSSPLLGKDAVAFKLPLLDGGNFDLAEEKGHVVVLDFWATWCGPCIKSLPGLIDSMAAFPSDKVRLIGVNQGEPPDQVRHFLEAKGLKLTVALDADQAIGRTYGVDAIPQTIIVGPDGKVAWTQTGYDPDGEAEASALIKHLLGEGSDPASKPATQ